MPTTTRDRTDELRALEELWAAPALAEPKAPAERRRALPLVPGPLLADQMGDEVLGAEAHRPVDGVHGHVVTRLAERLPPGRHMEMVGRCLQVQEGRVQAAQSFHRPRP